MIADQRRLEAAGLLLLPENAGAAARLDAVRLMLAHGQVDDSTSLEGLVRSEVVESLRAAEDHPAQPFTDQIAFDRTLSVLPGPRDDTSFTIRTMLHALFLVRPLPSKLRDDVLDLSRVALHVADGVTRRAGLGAFAVPAAPGDIVIPEAGLRRRLAEAVVLEHGDLAALPKSAEACLRRLALSSLCPVEPDRRRWIVTAPDLLLPALIEAVTTVFADRGMAEDLQERFDAAVFINATGSLARLGLQLAGPPQDRNGEGRHEVALRTDSGEEIFLVQLPSDLDSRPRRPEGGLPLRRIPPFDPAHDMSDGATILTISQPVADPYFESPSRSAGPWPVAMSAADLEVLSYYQAGDDRILPRFARAANEIRQSVDVIRCSTLDELRMWAENGESYWRPESDRAGVTLVKPGTALPWRIEVARGRHLRAAEWPGGGAVEISHRYYGDDIPIYSPSPRPEFVSRAITIGARPAWIVITAPEGVAFPDRRWLEDATTLVDAAAFWLWQLSPYLARGIEAVERLPLFEIELPANGLVALFTETGPTDGVAVNVREVGTVHLSFPSAIQRLGASNEGDAALARALYIGWTRALGGPFGPNDLDAVIEAVASPAQKRRLIPIDLSWNSSIAQADTPSLRRISKADLESWRAWGEARLLGRGVNPGPLDDPEGKAGAFRALVEVLFAELEQSIAQFDAELLPALVGQVEAAYRAQAVAGLEHPVAVVCFGLTSNVAANSLRDVLAIDHPTPASRFLIEYLAAVPPTGSKRASPAALDSLIALAALIIELGLVSDGIRYVDPGAPVSVSARGRLVYDTAIAAAMAEFGAQTGRHTVAAAADSFLGHWAPAPGDSEAALDSSFEGNDAFKDEFGYSLTELAELVNRALLIADDQDRSVIRIPRRAFVDELAARLGWEADRVSAVLDGLTLAPRSSFLAPPWPAKSHDTYPWRHNRRLSYLRRPFIQVGAGDARTVLYGTRHLAVVPRYLFALVASGRLPATAPAMRGLQAKISSAEGLVFVQQVARRCREAGIEARIGVWGLGGVRLAGPAGALGDIDVLAVDRPRSIVWLLECKSVHSARTPWELHSEVREFLEPGGHVARHVRRRDWFQANRALVAKTLVLDDAFELRAAIVTPLPVLAALLRKSELPILDLESLSQLLVTSDDA